MSEHLFCILKDCSCGLAQEKQALPKERMCVEIFTDDSMGIFLLDMVVCKKFNYTL
jgi:hypothetical protein